MTDFYAPVQTRTRDYLYADVSMSAGFTIFLFGTATMNYFLFALGIFLMIYGSTRYLALLEQEQR